MNDSGGNEKPNYCNHTFHRLGGIDDCPVCNPEVKVTFKLPPKRTPREWRELTMMKLRQYETINFEILGKKGRMSSGE